MDAQVWPCPSCEDEREFEQPPCADGHADDDGCPEWVCTGCGTALLTGGPARVLEPAVRRAA